jgi:hypothetical protein
MPITNRVLSGLWNSLKMVIRNANEGTLHIEYQ